MTRTAITGLLAALMLLTAQALAAAETLAIIPFKVNAQEDLSYLSEGTADMLESRLSAKTDVIVIDAVKVRRLAASAEKPLNRSTVTEIGKKLGADFVLWGSITRLGGHFSLDAQTINVSEKTEAVSVYKEADSLGGVIPAVDTLASEIAGQVFGAAGDSGPAPAPSADTKKSPGRQDPEVPLSRTPASQKSDAATSALPPSKSSPTPAGAAASSAASGRNTPFVINKATSGQRPGAADSGPGFWKSRDLKIKAVGLAVADLDEDGDNETVLLAEDKLVVQKMTSGKMVPVAERPAARHEKFLAVDTADTNGDKRAEIFVTAVNAHNNKLCSLVLELVDGQLKPVIEDQNWYFRAINATTVWGQQKGMKELFLSGIRRLEIQDGELVKAGTVNLPDKEACVYDAGRGEVLNNGKRQWIISDANDHLTIYSPAGKKIWESDQSFGGSETYVKTATDKSDTDETGRRRYLSQRVYITDINRDGRREVVTVDNKSLTGRWFKRFRKYGRASLVGLAWDGLGLSERWHTREVSGYAADFACEDIDNNGSKELAMFIVSSRGSVISAPRSCLITYDTSMAP